MKEEEGEVSSKSVPEICGTVNSENLIVPGKRKISDTGEQKKIRVELRESEDRFRLILENTSEGILIADVSTKAIKYSNPAICTMLGYTGEELQYMSIQQIHPEDSWSFVLSEFEAQAIGEKTMASNIPCVCKNGKIIHVDVSASPIVFDGIKCSVGFFRDMTEKRKAEEDLKKANDELQRLASIVKYSGELVNLSTLDGKMIFLNDAGGKMLGIAPDKVDGFSILDVIPEHLMGKVKSELFPRLLQGENWEGELQYINLKTKKLTDVHAMAFPIKDTGTGNLLYLANVSLDISGQKILEDKLRHSEKMEAIGHLAGGIAHDFNNQLLGIMGFAEILCEKLQDAEMKEDAENIVLASRRAADLVQDLLSFSRKDKSMSVSIDVHKIINEVSSILERSIDKKIQIMKKLNADPPFISGDPTQIQNALLNLAINARDALPEGGTIILAAERVHVDRSKLLSDFPLTILGECIKISVLDNGVGIDEETMKHIFEPFFTTKEPGKGTGMGLASVYGTVQLHKGAINVESEPGKGSRFELYFPVRADNETEKVAVNIPLIQGRKYQILFVDDEPIIRNLVSKIIESLGCKVVSCANGVEALKYYRESWKEIDLVILDMIMPKKSGKDTYLEMRSINKDIKAIVVSGYSFDGIAQTMIDAGICGFLQKPFSKIELSRKIDAALK